MPTIEIVATNSPPINIVQEDYQVAIISEEFIESHRGLFDEFLETITGVMMHLGSPKYRFEKDGFFDAGGIVDWDYSPSEIILPIIDPNDPTDNWGANQDYLFRFRKEFISEIDILLKKALTNSKSSRIFFLSDYQFGLEKARFEITYTIKEFWELHNSTGLVFNTLYEIYSE